MTNRELLELAAKAAGLTPIAYFHAEESEHLLEVRPRQENVYWAPLDDDGDAMRLAAALSISLRFEDIEKTVEARHPQTSYGQFEEYGTDKNKAVRRAIMLAAAEIGKAMP